MSCDYKPTKILYCILAANVLFLILRFHTQKILKKKILGNPTDIKVGIGNLFF